MMPRPGSEGDEPGGGPPPPAPADPKDLKIISPLPAAGRSRAPAGTGERVGGPPPRSPSEAPAGDFLLAYEEVEVRAWEPGELMTVEGVDHGEDLEPEERMEGTPTAGRRHPEPPAAGTGTSGGR